MVTYLIYQQRFVPIQETIFTHLIKSRNAIKKGRKNTQQKVISDGCKWDGWITIGSLGAVRYRAPTALIIKGDKMPKMMYIVHTCNSLQSSSTDSMLGEGLIHVQRQIVKCCPLVFAIFLQRQNFWLNLSLLQISNLLSKMSKPICPLKKFH